MTIDSHSTEDDIQYTLVGMRMSSDSDVDSGEISLEIVGSFDDLDKAKLAYDYYSALDTTITCLTILPSVVRHDIPQITVMLHLYVDNENRIVYESRCSFEDISPWMKATENEYDSLIYPEDLDLMIQEASQWLEEYRGIESAEIIDLISPEAREYI